MSASSRKDVLILAVLFVVAAIGFSVVVILGGSADDARAEAWIRSTRSTNLEGTIVCFELYRRFDFAPRRHESPFSQESLRDVDILFLLDPIIPLSPPEEDELEAWVRSGGVLIESGSQLGDVHDLTRPLRSIKAPAMPALASPKKVTDTSAIDDNARRIRLASSATLGTAEDEQTGLGPVEPLLIDEEGTRIAGRSVGRGYVIELADSSFLANGLIGEDDNMIVAANLPAFARSRARGSRLSFDEFHFGMTADGGPTGWSVLASMLVTTAPGWAVLTLTAAGLLFMIYRGTRFGARRDVERKRRRSKLEFLEGVGATYAHRGANTLTLQLIHRWLRSRAARRAGLPTTASTQSIARGIARHTGRPPADYEVPLSRMETATREGSISKRTLHALLRQAASIEGDFTRPAATRRRSGDKDGSSAGS